jgi:acetyltransferase-like isoleucine patch superfamily enzyme
MAPVLAPERIVFLKMVYLGDRGALTSVERQVVGRFLLKTTIRKLARLPLVTVLVRFALYLIDGLSRAASVLRTAALFPHVAELPRCHWSVTVKCAEKIKLGRGVVIGPKCTLGGCGGITLADNVRISEGVMIESAGLDFTSAAPYAHTFRPIVIEQAAWIGARAVILAGVTIGARSVVGAGAVVSRSVPPDTIVSGTGVKEWPRRTEALSVSTGKPG